MFVREAAGLPRVEGVTGTDETTLRDADDATRTFVIHFADGVVDAVVPGSKPDADMRIEMSEDVYVAFCLGDRDPLNRALLNGQVRMTGDVDKARPIRRLLTSAPYIEVLGRVHAQTAY